ncbi:hypothetical protein L6452_15234 [Arctium lappa]|uniref:Uncharacterized protein n=1 Tax=Arctium lappa TaxID=4217 RepID=A0ACB9CN72_ARCLA|nr:hypothetical protein L6452_15234 [Arctium lappa]
MACRRLFYGDRRLGGAHDGCCVMDFVHVPLGKFLRFCGWEVRLERDSRCVSASQDIGDLRYPLRVSLWYDNSRDSSGRQERVLMAEMLAGDTREMSNSPLQTSEDVENMTTMTQGLVEEPMQIHANPSKDEGEKSIPEEHHAEGKERVSMFARLS